MKALVIGLLFSGCCAAKEFGSVRVQSVVSVYDADTFRVSIEGWPPIIG